MDASHPFAIALSEIVVGGHDMHTFAGQGIEVGREGGDQGLSLTGLHLSDVAEVKRRTAHQLHVIVTLS